MSEPPTNSDPTAAQGTPDQRRGAFVSGGTFHGPFVGNQENHQHHHYPAPHPSTLDLHATRTRTLMLQQVRRIWIDGMLNRSLYGEVQLQLGLRSDPRKVDLPVRLLVQETGGEAEDLPDETQIADVFDRFGGALLILGAPGAGKTTLLLELVRELLDRAESDIGHPIPVVFTLSTWTTERKPLELWLVDQLVAIYQVRRKIAQEWIDADLVLPLLDGLDEVVEVYRADCVKAINTFRTARGSLSLVLCSRLREYETVAQETTLLRLYGAVVVQTLRRTTVLDALVVLGPEATALHNFLATRERDWLWSVAISPLGLSVLIPAVQRDPTLLQGSGSDVQRRDRIFMAYVSAMFERRSVAGRWSHEKTVHQLSWLAKAMQDRGQTLFLLEGLQSDWLTHRFRQSFSGRSISPFMGVVAGVFVGSFVGLFFGFTSGVISAIVAGLTIIVNSNVIGKKDIDITPIERINWSWSNARKGLCEGAIFGLFFGFGARIAVGLGSEFIDGPVGGLVVTLFGGLGGGLIGGLFGGMSAKIQPQGIEMTLRPNQGIVDSARSALIYGLLAGLAGGIVGGLVGGLSSAVVWGLLVGLGSGIKYGGRAVLQHIALRLLLARSGFAPLRYAAFLDHAADRVLLRRVGGGWIFVHRLLLDHFAEHWADEQSKGEQDKKKKGW